MDIWRADGGMWFAVVGRMMLSTTKTWAALVLSACAVVVSVPAAADTSTATSMAAAPLTSLDDQARQKADACKAKMKLAHDKLKAAEGKKLTGNQLRSRALASLKAWKACAADLRAFFEQHDEFTSHRSNMKIVTTQLNRAVKKLKGFAGGKVVSESNRAKLQAHVKEATEKMNTVLREMR